MIMRFKTTAVALLLASSPWVPPVSAQTAATQPFRVIAEGDLIPNLGELSQIVQTLLNDQGTFIVEVQAAGTPGRSLIRDGFLTFKQGIPLPDPPGWTVGTNVPYQSIEINASTDLGWILRVEDLVAGVSSEGLYINTYLLHLLEDPLDAAVIDSEALTTEDYVYDTFNYAYINDSDQFIFQGRIDIPGVNRSALTSIIRIDTDGAGTIIKEEILLRTGLTIEGKTVRTLPSRANGLAMNNKGEWISAFQVAGATRATDTRIILNGEVIISEGDLFAPLGLKYENLIDARVSINNFGDWSILVPIDSTRIDTIILNGEEIIAQEAAPISAITPDTVLSYGPASGPRVKLTDSGDVFWYGDLTGNKNKNSGFFRNQDLIVRKGDTLPEGNGIISIKKGARVFDASPSGRWWIAQVGLAGLGIDILVMADYGLALPVPGSSVNLGTLEKSRGDAQVGKILTFELGNPQGDGVLPLLFFSANQAIPGSPFGIMTNLGEILIDTTPGSIIGSFQAVPVSGGTASISLSIPADTSLIEFEAWGQGLFIDTNNSAPGEKIRLTNGFQMVIGAP